MDCLAVVDYTLIFLTQWQVLSTPYNSHNGHPQPHTTAIKCIRNNLQLMIAFSGQLELGHRMGVEFLSLYRSMACGVCVYGDCSSIHISDHKW